MVHSLSLYGRALPKPGELPVVKCTKVPERDLSGLLASKEFEAFGYVQELYWDRSANYVRWIQPLEKELAAQVEYDMDEQDKEWLDQVNSERAKSGHGEVSYEAFEVIMDKLEKDWFDLNSKIPKKEAAIGVEDSICAVCDDGECEGNNAIVFCDGCNLAVHQDCYGVPYIPEGQWLCRKCTVSPDKPVSCILCPVEAGAFKQTTSNSWAHLLCAIWIPEVAVANSIYMEPVDGIEHIPKGRWKLNCYLCHKKVGACIQCAKKTCFTAFHPSCAREYGLSLQFNRADFYAEQAPDLKAFCHKHTPIPEPEEGEEIDSSQPHRAHPHPSSQKRKRLPSPPSNAPRPKKRKAGKTSRAYNKTFASSGPPVVPQVIYEAIMEYTKKLTMTNKKVFVSLLCRYWSLKREARRGAGFLKRLHLEPWTASASNRQQSEVERAKKLELMQKLRTDLDNLRMLCDFVKKRELKKKKRNEFIKDTVNASLFPLSCQLRAIFLKIKALDHKNLFGPVVLAAEVPDYYDVVKQPMFWSTIDTRLEEHYYESAAEFQADVELTLTNARLYNAPGNPYNIAAARIQQKMVPILPSCANLDSIICQEYRTGVQALMTEEKLKGLLAYDQELPRTTPPPTPTFKLTLNNKQPAASTEIKRSFSIIPPKRTRASAAHEQGSAPVASTSANPAEPSGSGSFEILIESPNKTSSTRVPSKKDRRAQEADKKARKREERQSRRASRKAPAEAADQPLADPAENQSLIDAQAPIDFPAAPRRGKKGKKGKKAAAKTVAPATVEDPMQVDEESSDLSELESSSESEVEVEGKLDKGKGRAVEEVRQEVIAIQHDPTEPVAAGLPMPTRRVEHQQEGRPLILAQPTIEQEQPPHAEQETQTQLVRQDMPASESSELSALSELSENEVADNLISTTKSKRKAKKSAKGPKSNPQITATDVHPSPRTRTQAQNGVEEAAEAETPTPIEAPSTLPTTTNVRNTRKRGRESTASEAPMSAPAKKRARKSITPAISKVIESSAGVPKQLEVAEEEDVQQDESMNVEQQDESMSAEASVATKVKMEDATVPTATKRSSKAKKPLKVPPALHQLRYKEDQSPISGDQIWCAAGKDWWAAEVVEPTDAVPRGVLDAKPKAPAVLVNWLERDEWNWIPNKRIMYPMGDNAELDALMEQHASLPGPMRPYLLDGIAAAKSNRMSAEELAAEAGGE